MKKKKPTHYSRSNLKLYTKIIVVHEVSCRTVCCLSHLSSHHSSFFVAASSYTLSSQLQLLLSSILATSLSTPLVFGQMLRVQILYPNRTNLLQNCVEKVKKGDRIRKSALIFILLNVFLAAVSIRELPASSRSAFFFNSL